jgi:hypothetical protein
MAGVTVEGVLGTAVFMSSPLSSVKPSRLFEEDDNLLLLSPNPFQNPLKPLSDLSVSSLIEGDGVDVGDFPKEGKANNLGFGELDAIDVDEAGLMRVAVVGRGEEGGLDGTSSWGLGGLPGSDMDIV